MLFVFCCCFLRVYSARSQNLLSYLIISGLVIAFNVNNVNFVLSSISISSLPLLPSEVIAMLDTTEVSPAQRPALSFAK